jgi:hypothetical protein
MKKPSKKPSSKPVKGYKSPRLSTHGAVAKLTRHHGKIKPSCPGSQAFDNN